MSVRTVIPIAAVLSVVALLWFGLGERADSAISVGDPVPQPGLTELSGGSEADLERYGGKWILLNMWSSWCKPCRAEAPDLQGFHERHAGRLVVVGINLEDASAEAKDFVRELGLTYPQLRARDNRELTESFGMVGRPESFLVDPHGQIRLIARGPLDDIALRERVEPLLERKL